jgi:hypothetical protein
LYQLRKRVNPRELERSLDFIAEFFDGRERRDRIVVVRLPERHA